MLFEIAYAHVVYLEIRVTAILQMLRDTNKNPLIEISENKLFRIRNISDIS